MERHDSGAMRTEAWKRPRQQDRGSGSIARKAKGCLSNAPCSIADDVYWFATTSRSRVFGRACGCAMPVAAMTAMDNGFGGATFTSIDLGLSRKLPTAYATLAAKPGSPILASTAGNAPLI